MRGIQRSPVNSPHKGQWRGALMLSLICARINGWVNNREASDLRRHRTHFNVTEMAFSDRSNTGNHDGIYQHWQWYLSEIHKYMIPISFQHICQFWWYSCWMVKDLNQGMHSANILKELLLSIREVEFLILMKWKRMLHIYMILPYSIAKSSWNLKEMM